MSAVRASAPLTFIRPTPPLRGISAGYITIKEFRPQIKKKTEKLPVQGEFVPNLSPALTPPLDATIICRGLGDRHELVESP
jgi:hypothetical protein